MSDMLSAVCSARGHANVRSPDSKARRSRTRLRLNLRSLSCELHRAAAVEREPRRPLEHIHFGIGEQDDVAHLEQPRCKAWRVRGTFEHPAQARRC